MLTLTVQRPSAVGPAAHEPARRLHEALLVLESAREKADSMVHQAEAVKASVFERAYSEGFSRGRHDAVIGLLGVQSLRSALLKNASAELATLVGAICKEVLQRELSMPGDSIANRLELARRQIEGVSQFSVRINSAHSADAAQFIEALPKSSSCELQIDDSLPVGVAQLTTAEGTIDASPWEHFAAIQLYLAQPLGAFETFVTAILNGLLEEQAEC